MSAAIKDRAYSPLARGCFVVASIVSLGAIVGLLLVAEPNGDDFCRARLLPLLNTVQGWEPASNVVSSVRAQWLKWSGRWAAAFLQTVILSRTDITRFYVLLVFGTTLIFFFGLFIFVRAWLVEIDSKQFVATVVVTLGLLFWSRMPGPGDGFFWFTGAVENLLGPCFGLVVLAWLASLSKQTRGRTVQLALIAVAAFVVPAMHELTGVYFLLALSLSTLLVLRAKKDAGPWVVASVSAGAGLVLVGLAPGHAIRTALFPDARNLRVAIQLTMWLVQKYGINWVIDVPLLATTLLLVLDPRIRAIKADWVSTYLPNGWKFVVPIASLVFVGLGFLLPSYALGVAIPLRTLDTVYVTFLVGWFATTFVFTRGGAKDGANSPLVRAIASATLIVFALAITLSGNTRAAVASLQQEVRPWRSAVHARYEQLKATGSDKQDTVMLDRLPTVPRLFFGPDVLETPSGWRAWRNACLAGYFGLRAVALKAAVVPPDTQARSKPEQRDVE